MISPVATIGRHEVAAVIVAIRAGEEAPWIKLAGAGRFNGPAFRAVVVCLLCQERRAIGKRQNH